MQANEREGREQSMQDKGYEVACPNAGGTFCPQQTAKERKDRPQTKTQ